MRGRYSSPRRTRSTLKDLKAIAGMPWVTEESDGCVTVEIQVHHKGQQTEPLTLPVTVASDMELGLLCDVVQKYESTLATPGTSLNVIVSTERDLSHLAPAEPTYHREESATSSTSVHHGAS